MVANDCEHWCSSDGVWPSEVLHKVVLWEAVEGTSLTMSALVLVPVLSFYLDIHILINKFILDTYLVWEPISYVIINCIVSINQKALLPEVVWKQVSLESKFFGNFEYRQLESCCYIIWNLTETEKGVWGCLWLRWIKEKQLLKSLFTRMFILQRETIMLELTDCGDFTSQATLGTLDWGLFLYLFWVGVDEV